MNEGTNTRPLCVLGILDTPKGNEIAERMLEWLEPVYEVIQVRHDGSKFELPALREAQLHSIERKAPVLYIHTRGAVNTWPTTQPTHDMWREQFGNQWRKYFTIADDSRATVAAPFIDANGITRYNGFVANTAAWALLDLKETNERHDYEHLWKASEVRMIGTLIQRDGVDIKHIRRYLKRNYVR